jgi:hypothetical protein
VPAHAVPLSNYVRMSGPDDTQPKAPAESNGLGVLANLPRTRPQRSSPRRAAARARTAAAATREAAAETPQAAAKPGSSGRAPTTAAGARRTASKAGASKAGAGKASTDKASTDKAVPRKATKGKAAKSKQSTAAPAAGVTSAPRQGFECESEHSSLTVHPPGGAELVASVAEIVGEFAKAGLSSGERLLRDALSRLPL